MATLRLFFQFCLLGALVCMPAALHAQSEILYFHRLTPAQNLTSGSWNFYVHKDSRGFVWISSINGLNRFDGRKVRQYLVNDADSCALSNNNIQGRIFEDAGGDLWFCTVDALHRYDRKRDCFEQWRIKSAAGRDIDVGYRLLHLDPQTGDRWVKAGEDNGVYFWRGTDGALPVKVLGESLGLATEVVRLEQSDRYLLIKPLQDGGISVRSFRNGREQTGDGFPLTPAFKRRVRSIFFERENRIWLGADGGLVLFDLTTGKLNPYWLDANNPDLQITGIQKLNERRLIVSTLKSGLYYFDREREQFSAAILSATEDGVQPFAPEIRALYLDDAKNLWISTNYNGVYYASLNSLKFDYWLQNDVGSSSQKSLVVSVAEDHYDRIWAYTKAGVAVLDEYGRELVYFPSEDERYAVLKEDPRQIFVDNRNDVWLCSDGGLFKIRNVESVEELKNTSIVTVPTPGLCFAIAQIAEGKLLLATLHSGLFLIENGDRPRTRQLTDKTGESAYLFVDSRGNIFLYNLDQGIRWYRYRDGRLAPRGFVPSKHMVTGIVEDRPRNLYWIATHNGLMKMKLEGEGLSPEPFQPKVISGLLQDRSGSLWLSSKDGIYRYDPTTSGTIRFTLYDGLQGLEFLDWSSLSMKDGRLVFGGINGINVIKPEEIQTIEEIPRPLITEIHINNQVYHSRFPWSATDAGNVTEIRQITIPTYRYQLPFRYTNKVSFRFAALEYSDPASNQFRYQMTGIDTAYLQVGIDPMAHYQNIPPGNYTFAVGASNSDGLFDENRKFELDVWIQKPVFLEWWAFLFYFLFVGSLGAMLYSYFRKRNLERQETRRLKELDDFKTQFYTSITHEFRTPLTTILGMADNILTDPENWYRDGLKLIKRNGRRVLHLVNQILDISKLESGKVQLKPVQGDIVFFLRYILESFGSNAVNKGIQLHFLCEEPTIVMDYDPDKVMKVFVNLISNAVKYTEAGGHVYLQVHRRASTLEVSVKDTGIGVPPEHLDNIFNRYVTLGRSGTKEEKGTGIGLAIVKEIVHMLGGRISIASKVKQGTTMTVTLPITNLAGKKEKISLPPGIDEPFVEEPGERMAKLEDLNVGKEDFPMVLIVEDDPDVMNYTIGCLHPKFQIQVAFDGKAGYDEALKLIPDVVVSDVLMPKMDGYQLCDALKTNYITNHIPIILLTAKADVDSRIWGLETGADDYLTKPFNREELIIRIENLIRTRKLLQEKYAKTAATDIRTTAPPEEEAPEFREDPFVIRIREIEMKNLSDPAFGIAQLSREIGMSRSQLYRKFEQVTGLPIGEFRRQVKLTEARRLLKKTDRPISEIAADVGFSSQSSFSVSYKSHFNETPTETREYL